jgi:hypothetical protein
VSDEYHLAVRGPTDAAATPRNGSNLDLEKLVTTLARHPSKRTAAELAKIPVSGCRFWTGPIVVGATTNPNPPNQEEPMRYLLLIAGEENPRTEFSPEEDAATLNEYGEWAKTMAERGVLQGGERLRPTTDATTVRVRDGEVLSTDGPFAETKEQLGGYFLVDCKDLDEAIEVAGKLPGARYGSIEVRPIWEM